jgi:aspartyl aminopeptidase
MIAIDNIKLFKLSLGWGFGGSVKMTGRKIAAPAKPNGVRKSRMLPASVLAEKVLDGTHYHNEEDHGLNESPWDSLSPRQTIEVNSFAREYVRSLRNKCVPQRTKFIKRMLERHGYVPFEKLADKGGPSISDVMGDKWNFNLKPGHKFYVTYQDDLIIAVNMGRHKASKGLNVGMAHTDSPYLAGTGSFQQKDGIVYLSTEPVGGFDPAIWMNIPLAMSFKGSRREEETRRTLEFLIGDKEEDPCFFISNESEHLDDREPSKNKQLKVVIGTKPYPDINFDPSRRNLLGAMNYFNKRFGLTEEDFRLGEMHLFPAGSPRFAGVDKSLVFGFGQDDWACAFPMLYGFLKAKTPTFTSILQLHPCEEVGDIGRASAGANYLSEVVTPAIAYLCEQSLGDHYRGMGDSWSVWGDVMEARHLSRQDLHEARDSAYLGGGMILQRHSGDEAGYGAWRPSHKMLAAMDTLFREKGISYQVATMGNPENMIKGASATLHGPLFSEGVDWGVPMLGMHRAGGEVTNVADLYFLAKAAEAYFSVKSHSKYLPRSPRKK